MRLSLKSILSLCLLFSFYLSTAQDLPKDHPKYKLAAEVYGNIAHAVGGNKLPPELILTKKSQWRGAGFVYQPSPRIILEEKLFDLCQGKFGNQFPDALAIILGHELAHFYQNHEKNTSFAAPADKDNVHLEVEADYYGTYYGALAGYHTVQNLEKVLDLIYEAYQLPEQLNGYPSKSARYRIVREEIDKLSSLTNAFLTGQFLYLMKEYQLAADCFHYITEEFPSREIFNNVGVSYLALAMKFVDQDDQYYAYPFELDPSSRLQKVTMRAADQSNQLQLNRFLGMAKANLEQAVKLDPDYFSAHINLACVSILEDNQYAAIGRLNELGKKGQALSANAYLVRAIAYDKNGERSKAQKDFKRALKLNAFQGAYNLELFNSRASVWGQFRGYLKNGIGEWISNWWYADSECRVEEDQSIGQMSFARLLDNMHSGNQIKLPAKPVKFLLVNDENADGLYVNFAGSTEDLKLFALQTQPYYRGKTKSGIQIGSSDEEVLKKYCKPDYKLNGSGSSEFYFYQDQQIIFEMVDGKVKSWSLIRIQR